MRTKCLLLTMVMLFSLLSVPVLAEKSVIVESASGFFYIEANGAQPRLSASSADRFIQAAGLWFKDMNGNGVLDLYEDWTKPVADRVADLLSKMSLAEKAGSLGFSMIAGTNGVVAANVNNDLILYSTTPFTTQTSSGFGGVSTLSSMTYQILTMHATTFIAAMTGLPKDQLDLANNLQALAEDTPLGIPVVLSGDRSYNTWGGMIDMPHAALGVAHDPDLLYDLVSEYTKESVAIGYQQVFHGYGNEIGSFYGDDPEYIALMAATETLAYENVPGFGAHSKHFIARGGRNSYSAAKSPADLIDSWKIGWQAVVDAGTSYVMTNNSIGVTPGLTTFMDPDTFSILRDELGYDGVICLDWPMDASRIMSQTGVTQDGFDVSTLTTLGERYAWILDVGIDMFSCSTVLAGTDINAYAETKGHVEGGYFPDALLGEIAAGKYTEGELDVHVARIMKNKFELGIFENPYRDWGEALELIGSEAYQAVQFEILSNEDINRARRSIITELEEEVMVKSTILMKNEGILPLSADQRLYVDANNATIKAADIQALSAKATVVGTLAEADVAVIHVTSFNDAYQLLVDDAAAAGVPVVLIFEGTNDPALKQFNSCAALVNQTYGNTPDHGTSTGSFYRYVTPSVTAAMLFGEEEPAGSTLFEVGYAPDALGRSWGELQEDIGVDPQTRLYMAMMARENPAIDMPNNLGDVLYTTHYGMSYSNPSDIVLDLLTLPQKLIQTEVPSWGGRMRTVTTLVPSTPAGVPFDVLFVAKNFGGDGHITAQVKVDDAVVAEKFICLDEDQFRVISVTVTLPAGEHVITVGNLSAKITVE